MIGFAQMWVFLLLPLPALVWFFWPPRPAQASMIIPQSLRAFLSAAARRGEVSGVRLRSSMLFVALGWVALIVALAGPFTKGDKLVVPTGRDLVLAIDHSASMATTDMGEAARIDVAREMIGDFIRQREGDRIALIAFASDAFLVSPLTFDGGAVSQVLGELTIGLPGRKTDIGRAIGLAVKVFRDLPPAERALVLVSDGETNAGGLSAVDAARLAQEQNIVVHMIGFAKTIEPENERHMREISALTGGTYFPATASGSLEKTLSQIANIAPSSQDPAGQHIIRDWSQIALALAFCSAAIAGWKELHLA